jgi:hypothetical protein
MPDQRIVGVDGAGCIRRLEAVPMDDGYGVLLKITGSRPLAIELELSQLMDLRMELGLAHVYALGLQRAGVDRAQARAARDALAAADRAGRRAAA